MTKKDIPLADEYGARLGRVRGRGKLERVRGGRLERVRGGRSERVRGEGGEV